MQNPREREEQEGNCLQHLIEDLALVCHLHLQLSCKSHMHKLSINSFELTALGMSSDFARNELGTPLKAHRLKGRLKLHLSMCTNGVLKVLYLPFGQGYQWKSSQGWLKIKMLMALSHKARDTPPDYSMTSICCNEKTKDILQYIVLTIAPRNLTVLNLTISN